MRRLRHLVCHQTSRSSRILRAKRNIPACFSAKSSYIKTSGPGINLESPSASAKLQPPLPFSQRDGGPEPGGPAGPRRGGGGGRDRGRILHTIEGLCPASTVRARGKGSRRGRVLGISDKSSHFPTFDPHHLSAQGSGRALWA